MRLKKYFVFILIIVISLLPFNARGEDLSIFGKKQEKVAFLTFDDGPTPNNTVKIIDELNKNKIKATFFIVGQKGEEYPKALDALVKNKMCIMPHSYTHKANIYKSVENYNKDLKECIDFINNIQGNKKKNKIKFIRMPGGSYSTRNKYVVSNIRKSILDQGLNYVDWNVCSGDAEAHFVPRQKIINKVKKQCKDQKFLVILMHDSYYKKATVESISEVVKYIKEKGYKFKTFDDISEQEKNELIKMGVINKKQKIDK
ncbi:polysaccharide deacetylase family protein [Clostridium felsineum]|uniref:Peptidoglycan-N-acetylglucosamine deacetylase n=1 Tax=Clostridium felsineum TaxID=36839 RepID=A0A1S8LQB0_9CLOT|nr:polysaccharide deacetylase family protein [Clostridium felsineum]URZ05751.1 Peptidoglycan-N-acetylglucosamine deacetylase [Clostridium felsineum]URZ10790.1 Peptidoglycan-N-acetylglucosamine deacetylase [Clostridium felsineum]URZ15543.1 Peptidoglycan-N-acetylglucosamine deacetylase [Clostridium felsineum DSM 794]